MSDRELEIRNLLERLRVAWEKRPEWELGELAIRAVDSYIGKADLEFSTSEQIITAIEKLCEEKR